MDTSEMKTIIEGGLENEDFENFFLNDISYNLASFEENKPKLKSLQYRLNYGIIVQAAVSILIGISMYFNNV